MPNTAIAANTTTMYLWAANQDCSGSIPELKTNSAASAGGGAIAVTEAASSGALTGSEGLDPAAVVAGGADVNLAAISRGPCGGMAISLAIDGAAAVKEKPVGFESGTAATAAGGLRAASCGRSWPRHFFSSHSTQSTRPAEIGKPQASHFLSPRSMGGTLL